MLEKDVFYQDSLFLLREIYIRKKGKGNALNEGIRHANLDNLTYAFAALYLLEFEYMNKIGTLEERVGCGRSILFGMGDLEKNYISNLFISG